MQTPQNSLQPLAKTNQISGVNKLPPVTVPKNPMDYQNPDIPERKWKLSYGRTDTFYLTDLEREYYLAAISNGVVNVQIGALTLSNHPLYMAPIKKGRRVESVVEVLTMSETDKEKALLKLDEIRNKLKEKLSVNKKINEKQSEVLQERGSATSDSSKA